MRLGHDHPHDTAAMIKLLALADGIFEGCATPAARGTVPRLITTLGHGGHARDGVPRVINWTDVRDTLSHRSSARYGAEPLLRHTITTGHHLHGTCAMGRVVDTHFRVFGVDGLRVADASVVPIPYGANTNAVCLAIGELCARDVLQTSAPSSRPRIRREIHAQPR